MGSSTPDRGSRRYIARLLDGPLQGTFVRMTLGPDDEPAEFFPVAHERHGAYVLANADLFGFTRQEQQVLAFLVRAHRRAIPIDELNALPERLAEPASRVVSLLRLAALMHRGRGNEAFPEIAARAGEKLLRLTFPATWLEGHPLTRTDLDTDLLATFLLSSVRSVTEMAIAGRGVAQPTGEELWQLVAGGITP